MHILKKKFSHIKNYSFVRVIIKYRFHILFALLLILHIFLRSYQLFERANIGWDQIDSARAAKHIIADHRILLNGPVAKGNSGIYMGPLYYYAIAIFYFFTNLDPIASPLFQLTISVINLLVLFFVTKKIFGLRVAFMA